MHQETGILYKLPAWLFFLDVCTMMYMGQLYAPAAGSVRYVFEFMYVRYQEEAGREGRGLGAGRRQKGAGAEKTKKTGIVFSRENTRRSCIRSSGGCGGSRCPAQVLVIMSEAFLAAVICFVLSGYRLMESRYTMESSITGEGLYGLFRSLGVVMGACCLLMMTLLFSWFIREQKKEYRMLTILGMRRHTAWRIVLLGAAGNALAAAIPGMAVGCVCARQCSGNSFCRQKKREDTLPARQ